MSHKITFMIPERLKNDLRHSVISDGYGLRGKSKWVYEAIEQLIELTDFAELVSINDEMTPSIKGKSETIVVDDVIKRKIDFAVISTRKEYPALEGVQSRIVRTAIIQRMLRT